MLMRYDPFRVRRPLDRSVPMAAVRSDDAVTLRFDLPGFGADEVDLSVEHGTLTITGERSWSPADGERLLAHERWSGSFRREFRLGDNLDIESVDADFTNGVLTVRLPIVERAKARKVEISSGALAA